MKRLLLALSIITTIVICNIEGANAQSVNVNINIGRQPAWGPVGYNYVGYYYFPDIDIYYSVDRSLFYYWDGRGWIGARYLPPRYAHYDLYRTYKVVINDRDPWKYNPYHRKHYAHYRGNYNQVIILNAKDHRYHNSRNNRVVWVEPKHSNSRYSSGRDDRNRHSSRNESRYESRDSRDRNGRYSNNKSTRNTSSERSSSASGRSSSRR